jgi:hypothetical protein
VTRQNSTPRSISLLLCLLAVATISFGSLGCGATWGPRVETRYVLVKPGQPCQVMENKRLMVRVLTDWTEPQEPYEQDLGGWICMPEEHWKEVKKILEEQ